MNSFFIQYDAALVKNAILAQQLNTFSQEWLVFCLLQINVIIFEV